MDDKELTRLAEQEILRETKRAAERAAVYGALGWMKCPLKPTNKQFLMNTILPTLSTNKRYHHADKRDYRKLDKECSCQVGNNVLPSTGERSSHHPKKESVGDYKYPLSNRESNGRADKYNHERHDKDGLPSFRQRLSENKSLDNNSKESRLNCLDNKITEPRNNADGHKDHKSSKDRHSSSTSHKFHKDDKHACKRNDSLHQQHRKNHDCYNSANHRYKDDVEIDCKTKIAEVHSKSNIVSNENEHNEFGNCKVWNGNHKLPDTNTNSKLKYSKSAIKENRVKDEPSYTGSDRNGHFITESPRHSNENNGFFDNKDRTSGIYNNRSKCEKDKDKKNVCYSSEYSHHSKSAETARKSTRKMKRDKSVKRKDRHDDRQRLKKKKRKTSLTTENNIKAVVSNKSSAKKYKMGKEAERVKHDAGSSKKKRSRGDTVKADSVLTENERLNQGDLKYYKQNLQSDLQHRVQESNKQQAADKVLGAKKSNVAITAEKRKAENKSENSKHVKRARTTHDTSDCHVRNYSSTSDEITETKDWNNVSRFNKNPNYSKKNNVKNQCHSENYKSKNDNKYAHSGKDYMHSRGKSNCLRDITDEMRYRDTENSKKTKRRRWSIESS